MSSLWPNHLLGQANLHLLRSPSMILSTATIFKIQPSHWVSGILIYIWNTADSLARLHFENCGRICDSNTALILLDPCILPASSKFGQGKHSEKDLASTFRPKGVCSPMYTGLFTFYDPSQYLSSFSSPRLKSKKIPFFTKFHCHFRKICFGLLRTQFWCHRPSQ